MCEVQGVSSERGASPPPGRLSVSSSGAEENHNSPRDSLLLGRPDEGHAGKPSEDTSNSGEIEASEFTPATSSKMKEEKEDVDDNREKKRNESEEEGDIKNNNRDEERKEEEVKEKYIDEERREKDKMKEKQKDEERKEEGDIKGKIEKEKITDEEKDKEEEVKKDKNTVNLNESEKEEKENVKESESEAKDAVLDFIGDDSERENQENERRDEIVENKLKLENVENTVQVEKVEITFRMEKEIKEKVEDDDKREEEVKEEENRRGNDEQAASSLDSPKVEERKQEEEEEEKADKTEKKKVEQDKQDDERGEGEDKHEDGVKNKSEEEVQGNEVKKVKEERDEKEKEEEKEEGVDPFRPKSAKDASTTRKVAKTVNFLDAELKKQIENNLSKRHTLNSTSSYISSSSSKSKEEEDEQELARLEGETEVKHTRQWTLGEGNPVYRLSLKLSPNLFNSTDIPGANQHKEVEKTGFLNKLSGRSFPYIPQWKRRYCVLSKGRLYYYEREDSKAGDKANGVIQLEYFDQVAEAGPKECKKATNVFIITSQDRSFFDPGRHLFSADTLPDMKDWIRRLQAALDQIRNNNRPAASTSPSASPSAKDGGGKRRRDEAADGKDGSKGSQQQNGNKDRKKKKEESGRGRKSSRGGVSSQTQTTMVAEPVTSEVDGGRPTSIAPKGGVMLPGFSSRKDPQVTSRPAKTRSGEGEAEEDLPQAGPRLSCITKERVKGPQGRRAPQSRRVAAAAALKKRASSLSALEHQDAADNSEAPWLNRSLDVLEGGNPWGRRQAGAAAASTNLPYKAYNYSSDEDDLDDDHSDSFPASASASGMPPPPPPRSASYGLELRSASQDGASSRERQEPRRSRADPRGSHGDLVGSRDSLGMWRGSHGEAAWQGSRGSLGQNGRASPVMDDLDNLLMNQSVQHSSAALDTASDAGSEGSSTCRATDHLQPPPGPDQCPHHHHHHHHHTHQQQQPRKKSHDLSRFATAVRHLQRHVVEIDRAVFAVTGDVAGTRREVETLREAVAALQTDADTITTTLSNLTQEAITAQQKISFATQEAEKVQLSVKEALREAEKARQEQLRSRREYEELVSEMRLALQLFREKGQASVPIPDPDAALDEVPDATPAAVTKSSSGSQVNKGYQSLFSKSSSIISGLTNRHSLSKSVSFADQKDKDRRKSEGTEAKASSLDRNKQYDKKDKKDAKSQASVQSKEKESKKDKQSSTMEKKESKQQQKQKSQHEAGHSDPRRAEDREAERKGHGSVDRRERRARQEGRDKRGHVISPLALDDIPLADDVSQEHEVKSDASAAPSSGSDPAEAGRQKTSFKQTINISLGQPSTSTTGTRAGASSRPHVLPSSHNRHSGELTTSNGSLDSPLAASSFTRPGSFLPTLEESPPVSETTSLTSLHQPGSTPGPQARQGPMSTVSKDRPASTSSQARRGTFAISRQHSSPNIPLQRQNSGSAFPIQRQQSLGTVPEGRLPRQESLTSVPEDRPLADRTLPLSPSPSLTYFPLSPTASSSTISDSARRAARESMELVTGPVLAGSAMQEANATGTLPALPEGEQPMEPAATSSLKRTHDSHPDNVGILV